MKTLMYTMLAMAIAGAGLTAGQEPDEKDKPKQQEPKKQQSTNPPPRSGQEPESDKPKPKPKQEPGPPPKQQRPDERQQPQTEKERQKEQKKQQKEQANTKQQRKATEQNPQAQQSPQRSGGKGQRIPAERFRASFGREHHFRVVQSGGDNRRFQYAGYWFEVVEVWPVGWSFDDECYLDEYDDDYYLVDVVHPEIRVLVIVVSG